MLVGRQAEQQVVDRLLSAARLGESGVLALTGEAGTGKTALLDDTVTRLSGMRVLRATGLESEAEIPFAGLLQVLRPALHRRDEIPPAQAAALSAALVIPTTPTPAPTTTPAALEGRDRFTIGAAVLSLVCRYAEDGPVAVLVDDLHLLDAPSADALLFAARRLAVDPVAVLLAVRSPEGDHLLNGIPSLRLAGLDLDAARALVTRAHGSAMLDESLALLHQATEGNPLALIELAASDPDVIESVATGMPLRVPRAIADAFGRRLAQLDEACRAALLVAAVCGGDLRVVTRTCAALGLDAGLLGTAEDRGLVRAHGGRVEFRHPLVRSAVYSFASDQDRRAVHRAAADAVPSSDVDRRAWHLSEALWHPDAAVAALLVEAGEHAAARAAYAVASGAFERAARLTPDDGARDARLLRAADAAWAAGAGERAVALLDERAREAGRPRNPDIRDLALRASIAARTGSLRDALDTLLAAAELSDRPDDTTVLLADAVHATYYLGDARTAFTLAERLRKLRDAVTEPRARALGLMATGIARILAGHGGADDIRAAIPLLETDPELTHDPRRLSWLLLAPLFLRDATSGARLRALVDEVRGAAGVGALPAVLFHVARDEATTAALWARAEADYTESIRLAAETGQTTEQAMSFAGLCWLESRMGRAQTCRAHGAKARALCVVRDIHMGEVWVGAALGELELSLGHADAAAAHLLELTALLERLGLDDVDLLPAPELTEALLRLGRHDEARRAAHGYRERALEKGQPWALARAERACGQAAQDDEVDERFAAAFDWHAQTLDRFEIARTRLAYGERLRRAGRRVAARDQLRDALEGFDGLGASVWSDRAATELSATGERVRRATANAAAALTPQELQVSLLLAEGRTTRQTAAALFLSPKTVEYHLRKVYTKLGIGSRAELAAAVAGSGSALRDTTA